MSVQNPMQGILLKCASVAVFTVMAAMVKATSETADVPISILAQRSELARRPA